MNQHLKGKEKYIEEYFNPIKLISSILNNFDDDQEIPVFAFGAKLPPLHTLTSNCFALSGKLYNPFYKTSEDVIKAL